MILFRFVKSPGGECQANIDAFELIKRKVDREGVKKISEIVSGHDGIRTSQLIRDMLR